MKIDNLTKTQIANILELIACTEPMINNPEMTADPRNRALVYAVAALGVELLPQYLTREAPIPPRDLEGREL